jgi:hypothetical protein
LESLQKIGEEINIDTLISDASEAIRNAFKNIFGEDLLIIMCWAHVRRNVVKHLHLVDEEFRDDIMNDIDALQLASSKEIFDKAMPLFIKKWLTKKQKDFIEYMKEMWFYTHSN